MSMIIGRKQVILAVLVIALGAAIYLNFIFSGNNIAGVFNSGATLGGASYVVNQKVSATSGTNTANFFSAARLNRQQTRDKAVATLKTQTTNASLSATDKQSAEAAIEAISKSIVTEGQIESTIKSKGFSDCMVFLNDGGATVIVKPKTGSTLSDSDSAQIYDIIKKQTNLAIGKININIAK